MRITLDTASQLFQSLALLLQQIQIMQQTMSNPQSKLVGILPEDELKAQDLNKQINALLDEKPSPESQHIVEYFSSQVKEVTQSSERYIKDLNERVRVLETRNHTLEEFFQRHQGKVIDFELRAEIDNGCWRFYIHPANVDGETWTFNVNANQLACISVPSLLFVGD